MEELLPCSEEPALRSISEATDQILHNIKFNNGTFYVTNIYLECTAFITNSNVLIILLSSLIQTHRGYK